MIRLIFLIIFSRDLYGKDLGTFGEVFPIIEENFLTFIGHKLEDLKNKGKLQQYQKNIQDKIKEKLHHPMPVIGIKKALISKTHFYDPSIVVPYDLKDHTGRVFHKKGTRFNPLQTRFLTKNLIFLDGEDDEQVLWALKERLQNPHHKLILVKGSPFILSQNHGVHFYFDQEGKITQKLGIKEVPAVVSQWGRKLKIQTIHLRGKDPYG